MGNGGKKRLGKGVYGLAAATDMFCVLMCERISL